MQQNLRPLNAARWTLAAIVAAMIGMVLLAPGTLRRAALAQVALVPSPAQGASVGAATLACCEARVTEASASWRVALRPRRDYLVAFRIHPVSGHDIAPLSVRLQSETTGMVVGSFDLRVAAGESRNIARTIAADAGLPAVLRIFHTSDAHVELTDLTLREIPQSLRVAQAVALLALAIAVAGLAWTIRRARSAPRLRMLRANLAVAYGGVMVVGVLANALINAMLGPPMVMLDEFFYSEAASRALAWLAGLGADQGIQMPNRLFTALYALTPLAHDPYAAARALNLLALAIGGLALSVAGIRLGSGTAGPLIVAAFLTGPLAAFTGYFMPESWYIAFYLLTTLLIAIALVRHAPAAALAAGACNAALVFIKPHGWAVLAVLAVTAAALDAARWRSGQRSATSMVFAAGFVVTWAFLNLVLPEAAPGRIGLGSLYGHAAERLVTTVRAASQYAAILELAAVHLIVVMTIAAPALIFGAHAAWRAFRTPSSLGVAEAVAALSTLSLLALVGLASAFTLSAVGTGPFELTNRLHGRYYTFALPLLVLTAVSSEGARKFFVQRRRALIAAWAGATIGAIVLLPAHRWRMLDYGEIYLGEGAPLYAGALFGAIGVTVAWLAGRREGSMAGALVTALALCHLATGIGVRGRQLTMPELAETAASRFAAAYASTARVGIHVIERYAPAYRLAAYAPDRIRFHDPFTPWSQSQVVRANGALVIFRSGRDLNVPNRPLHSFGPYTVGVVDATHDPRPSLPAEKAREAR